MAVCVGDGGAGPSRPGMGVRRAMNHPDPSAVGDDCWALLEETAKEVVNYVHPTMDSEEKRSDITEFLQKLIRSYAPCEVLPYGSVPLKTYLPEGDIDLTAVSAPGYEESLAHNVLAILQAQQQKPNAEYDVRDTHFIDAEVKIVRCVVQDIVIDISFNQLGGLCTLCFLEQVDRLVGKNHLFKRTIMLIKCWCYYESRILGALHGLISTYALEILVLYIFQLFHASLNTPVAVLYRFLDYYSKFDWGKYCISLNGPVLTSSLPEIVVDLPENRRNDLLLGEEFLMKCMEMFSVPAVVPESNKRAFQQKHLNIIDPLKENNNVGRSVHKGNYYRICSAFKYGVRTLGQILSLPQDKVRDEVKKFFSNTIKMHGPSYLAKLKTSTLSIGGDSSVALSSPSPADYFSEDDLLLKSPTSDSSEIEDDKRASSILTNDPGNTLTMAVSSEMVSEKGCKDDKSSCNNEKPTFVDEKSGCGGPSCQQPECDSASISGDSEVWNPLADLTGDYDGHIRSLLYGKCCRGFAATIAMPSSPPWFHNNNGFLSVTDRQPMMMPPPPQHFFPQTNMNAMFVVPSHSAVNILPPAPVFNFPEKLKTRGTGTFLPTMIKPFRERAAGYYKGKGKSKSFAGGYGQLHRSTVSKGWVPPLPKETVNKTSSNSRGEVSSPAFRPYAQPLAGSHMNGGHSCTPPPFTSGFGSPRQHHGFSHAASSRFAQSMHCASPVRSRNDRFADQTLIITPEEQ
ncbi:unnamed protein product [Cuscuta campestris]|uniref:Polymerase nucleotidyl transferase domain-containing protein n=1 Tax=Cuscuta campestris TaxID=132261 RepID=A0A484LV97_9ASTE|nr:unnamed protein product [Cuscuta campestris]